MTCSVLTDTHIYRKAKTEAGLRAFGVLHFSPSSRSGPIPTGVWDTNLNVCGALASMFIIRSLRVLASDRHATYI